jgi:hypothetical protein
LQYGEALSLALGWLVLGQREEALLFELKFLEHLVLVVVERESLCLLADPVQGLEGRRKDLKHMLFGHKL